MMLLDRPKTWTQRLTALVTWAVLGAAAGALCTFLPEHWRGPCIVASKLVGALK